MTSPRKDYKRDHHKDSRKHSRKDSYKDKDKEKDRHSRRDSHHDRKRSSHHDSKPDRKKELSKELKLKDEITEKIKKLVEDDGRLADQSKIDINGNKEISTEDAGKPKKRKSRWSSEYDRVLIPGLPVALAGIDLTKEQQEMYVMQLKVEEISLKLRTGNLGIPVNPEDRSPSPEPVYNSQGVRLNTREIRVRQKLEEERHILVRDLSEKNSEYRPPPDYKIPANKLTDKVFIPQERYPNINFIGLIIGPRGNTLKKLETDTNCKIIIRGKGSLKEGKLRLAPMPGEDEPLHALITAPSEECLAKGISTIKRIIKDGIDCPDGNNELRQMQLRELAELNGTLIGAEIARCRNCGSTDHRHWECTETVNFTNMLVCPKCGSTGHLVQDCIYEGDKVITAEEKAKMDEEYQSLMKELGVSASNNEYPQMLGLPKSMINDLPWANNPNSYLNSNNSNGSYSLTPNAPLPIAATAYNTDPALAAEIPYCPGIAPMPSFCVRTLLSQSDQSNNQASAAAWTTYNNYASSYSMYGMDASSQQMYPPGYPASAMQKQPHQQQQPTYVQPAAQQSVPPPSLPAANESDK